MNDWRHEFPDDPLLAELHQIGDELWSEYRDIPDAEFPRVLRERTTAALAESGYGYQRQPDGTRRIVPLADADPTPADVQREPAQTKRT